MNQSNQPIWDHDLYAFLNSGREDSLELDYGPDEKQSNCLDAISIYLGGTPGMDIRFTSNLLYRRTKCGACLSATNRGVFITADVEGSDFSYKSDLLQFLDDTEVFLQQFISLVKECESTCDREFYQSWIEETT